MNLNIHIDVDFHDKFEHADDADFSAICDKILRRVQLEVEDIHAHFGGVCKVSTSHGIGGTLDQLMDKS